VKAPCAGGEHFVVGIPLRVVIPLLANRSLSRRTGASREASYLSRSNRPAHSGLIWQDSLPKAWYSGGTSYAAVGMQVVDFVCR
jgi:hypothetical protein